MTSAIWTLAYDIADSDRDRYLQWFHHDHIAEKLARDGYRWAAHYEGPPHGPADGTTGFVAMFGGDATRIFLNPSPAQLKTMQDDTTRQMIGMRRPARMAILAHEWTLPDAVTPVDGHPAITLLALGASRADETIGAWAVQDLTPALTEGGAAGTIAKFVSVTGAPHHYIVAGGDHATTHPIMRGTMDRLMTGAAGLETAVYWRGQRIWPA
jgi:hypothetical protein